jgi:hypothetical protein
LITQQATGIRIGFNKGFRHFQILSGLHPRHLCPVNAAFGFLRFLHDCDTRDIVFDEDESFVFSLLQNNSGCSAQQNSLESAVVFIKYA